jgi:tripartite-type tricarboxylate transporter receptor subunit TctC
MKDKGEAMGRRLQACMLIVAVGVLFAVLQGAVFAKEYPERPITMIVPYPPGGVTDLGARALASAMEKQMKQPVVVVNKPGGGTTIGGNAVATAKPDGYTLGYLPTTAGIPEAFSYFYEAFYTSKELRPVACVGRVAITIAVRADAPWNTLKEFIEYARKNPGIKVATHGKNDMPLYLGPIGAVENVKFVDVPFGGDPQIATAILGGHVQVGVPAYPGIKSLLDAKKVRILAMCLEKRADFAPDIPTTVELGYKLGYVAYNGVFGPKGLPEEIVKKLDAVIAGVTKEQNFRATFNTMGTVVSYENTALFEKTQEKYKENLFKFFKEAGLVK